MDIEKRSRCCLISRCAVRKGHGIHSEHVTRKYAYEQICRIDDRNDPPSLPEYFLKTRPVRIFECVQKKEIRYKINTGEIKSKCKIVDDADLRSRDDDICHDPEKSRHENSEYRSFERILFPKEYLYEKEKQDFRYQSRNDK